MIGGRYIDGDKLLERIFGKVEAPAGIISWLKRQPRAPKLVNRQGAAEILGVSSPHLSRLEDRLAPHVVPVEGGSWVAYDRAGIEALAKELEAERTKKVKA